jgi:hypothetical protein
VSFRWDVAGEAAAMGASLQIVADARSRPTLIVSVDGDLRFRPKVNVEIVHGS